MTSKPHSTVPETTSAQVERFLAKYTPAIALSARRMRRRMRRRMPGGFEFVYDNYNFLVFGYGPTGFPSDAVVSLALAPAWVSLCFLKGATLPDPKKLLRGGGKVVRSIRLTDPAHLDDPDVESFLALAIGAAEPPFPGSGAPRTVIRSVSDKQRPRRPSRGEGSDRDGKSSVQRRA